MAIALLLTLTRGAWVGCAMALVLTVGIVGWQMRDALPPISRKTWLIAVVVLLAGIGCAAANPVVRERMRNVVNWRDTTVQSRFIYMQSAIGMFRARPLCGWGVGTFTVVSPQFRPAANITESGVSINQVATAALPHNMPLQIAAEMGLCGSIPYAVLVLVILSFGWRNHQLSPGSAG